MISFPAPALSQFEDEELLLTLGEHAFPNCVRRSAGENGLRLWVQGDTPTPELREIARFRFGVLLGALRSWRAGAGELQVERLQGLGPGAARDDAGNQFLAVGPAVMYDLTGGPHITFGQDVSTALSASTNLSNALWLNGRIHRSAADFYMIHEYAQREFGGTTGIGGSLGLSLRGQKLLCASANNLSPLRGGRHADPKGDAPWSLEQQERYIADLVQRWVYCRSHDDPPGVMPYRRRRGSGA